MPKITYYNSVKMKLPLSCLEKIRKAAKKAQTRKNCGTLLSIILTYLLKIITCI